MGQERLESLKAAWPTTSEKISHQIEAALFARPIFGAREAGSLKGNKADIREKIPHQNYAALFARPMGNNSVPGHFTKPRFGKSIAFVVTFYCERNLPSLQP